MDSRVLIGALHMGSPWGYMGLHSVIYVYVGLEYGSGAFGVLGLRGLVFWGSGSGWTFSGLRVQKP